MIQYIFNLHNTDTEHYSFDVNSRHRSMMGQFSINSLDLQIACFASSLRLALQIKLKFPA